MSSPALDPAHRRFSADIPVGRQSATADDNDDEDEDGWSEDYDDPVDDVPRKRKRATKTVGAGGSRPMSVSCELCKQRKVKCDRGHPQCGWCVRNGQICEYKERKKPGLRAGYGRELESRLDKLEGVLQAQQTLLQQLANHLPGGNANSHRVATASVADFSSPASHQTLSQAGRAEQPPLFTHTPATSYTPVGVTSQRNDESRSLVGGEMGGGYFADPSLHRGSITSPVANTSEGYAPSNPPLQSPSLNIHGTASGSARANGILASSHDHDFPPYDLLYSLTDLFFKHVNTWCPILHRRSTLDTLFGPTALEDADRILLHAIVATTLRFSTDARLNDTARDHYHSTSKQKVLLYGLENSSVKALQALVILALDTVGSSNGPPGWNLLALITRSVVQLGLAVEATSSSVAPLYPSIYTLRAMVLPEPKSFIEDESRRRLFWMVYLLDRYATIATAFEFALDEKEIDRKLPCRDDLFSRNQPVETRWFRPNGPTAADTASSSSADYDNGSIKRENLGSFSYYVEIIGILSQVHQFLKRPVDIGALADVEKWQQEYRQLDARLNAWKFGLPSEYGNMSRLFIPNGGNKIVNCIWIMLHVTYHTTVIRLHSSAAYPTTRSPIFTPSYAASQRCLTAVEEICALCSYVRSNALLPKLGPPFAFSCWVAARLLLVHGSTIDHVVNPAIGNLIETLRDLAVYWRVAERYATLLQRVMDEYQDAAARHAAQPFGVRETPSTVRILADMRRTAFDLDFLISRQPRVGLGAAGVAGAPSGYNSASGDAGPVDGAADRAIGNNANGMSGAAAGVSGQGGLGRTGTSLTTPARTPAPNELEYLDVFDFFNLPRLPQQNQSQNQQDVNGSGQQSMEAFGQQQATDGLAGTNTNEFNITNFMYDANADWLGDMGK